MVKALTTSATQLFVLKELILFVPLAPYFNLKWLCSTKMPSRRLYSRHLRKCLVFMKNLPVVELLSLVLLAPTASLYNIPTTWKPIFGSKTLILYSICYEDWRKIKDYYFSIFFLTEWDSLCWRLDIMWLFNHFYKSEWNLVWSWALNGFTCSCILLVKNNFWIRVTIDLTGLFNSPLHFICSLILKTRGEWHSLTRQIPHFYSPVDYVSLM